MQHNIDRDQRIMWAFWIAAGLVAIGAVAPIALAAGINSRVSGVIIPFAIAAVALGANALMSQQGKPLAAALYFVAGLAIVYGILTMVAVPLRLAVVGTCPPAPAHCPPGFEQPLTGAESNAIGVATFFGLLAIFVGFYGLVILYRRRPAGARPQPSLWPSQPPAPPAPPPPAAPVTAPAPAAPAEAEAAEEPKELPAPEEPKELPPPPR